jgi:hypothetical protein
MTSNASARLSQIITLAPIATSWKRTAWPLSSRMVILVRPAQSRRGGSLRSVRGSGACGFVYALARWGGNPISGDNGLGVVMRFAGHIVRGPRNFPVAQPKWGYQPFGAIAWLRWQRGEPDGPAVRQFMYGDTKEKTDYGTIPGTQRGDVPAESALPDSAGRCRRSRGDALCLQLWDAATSEPSSWDWEHVQVSEHALRRGGVALVAHHVDASFGDISIVPLPAGPPES